MKVCDEHRNSILNEINSKVLDMSIKRNFEYIVNLLKPISIALSSIEGNRCTIAKFSIHLEKIKAGALRNNKFSSTKIC